MIEEFLDEPREIHAVWHGFSRSLYSAHPLQTPENPKYEDSKDEPHYFKFGWVCGDIVQLVGITVAAKYRVPL